MDKLKINLKNWINKNKFLLILFTITTVISIFTGYFLIMSFIKNLSDLRIYVETGIMSEQLGTLGIFGIISLIIFIIWIVLILLIIWKVLFPSKESVKNAFCVNQLEYLIKLPSEIKRELKKYE
ncbi:hypothetical protein [Pallidibacillus thermolactis]|jgi:hypothetical protein|uniref:hypothetical protein n=1 Tax=Pallidibacillus thermolactis TaxID=251051 RepID=UPI0021D8D2A5|nr:hypothetical protein [Pallidibacillus thermolactis]MCU9601766.1 hypothetical protein [Pallidibacillus thermolactis subsp. kokeshiiformis]